LALNNPAPQEFVVANDRVWNPCPINGKIQIEQSRSPAVEELQRK
jgi:hypothetical protein